MDVAVAIATKDTVNIDDLAVAANFFISSTDPWSSASTYSPR